jgi:hypothetical protein
MVLVVSLYVLFWIYGPDPDVTKIEKLYVGRDIKDCAKDLGKNYSTEKCNGCRGLHDAMVYPSFILSSNYVVVSLNVDKKSTSDVVTAIEVTHSSRYKEIRKEIIQWIRNNLPFV